MIAELLLIVGLVILALAPLVADAIILYNKEM